MTTRSSTFTSAQIQGEFWGRHPEVWASMVEPQMRPIYTAALGALEPLRNRELLDAGCGAGLALSEAARRGVRVSGLDASAPLLGIAGRRVPAAVLHRGEIERLPFADESFDAVTAFNAIQYARQPARAVAELARVARPGGTVAIGIWGDPRRCETEGLFQRLRSLVPISPGNPAPLACSEAGVVEELLCKAGLAVAAGGEVDVPFVFNTIEDACTAHTSSGAVQKIIDQVGTEPVREVITAVLRTDRKLAGVLRQDNIFRYVLATKA